MSLTYFSFWGERTEQETIGGEMVGEKTKLGEGERNAEGR